MRTLIYRMDIGKLVEWIKLSPRHLVPLSLFTSGVLFAPARFLALLGPVSLVPNYQLCTSRLNSGGRSID